MNWMYLFGAVGCIVALTTIYKFVLERVSKAKEKRKEKLEGLGNFFGGNWNNQGQIKNKPTHYIDLDGWSNGNNIDGRFNVRNSFDENSWEMFRITGKRKHKELHCEVMRKTDDAEILIARGVLKKVPDGLLWILTDGDDTIFPKETLLRRGLPKIA